MSPADKKHPPPLSRPTRLVATLFYKTTDPRSAHADSSTHSPLDTLPPTTLASLTHGSIPTDSLQNYPLEPPTPGPDPLDHLYGAYLSQSCLNEFVTVLGQSISGFDGSKMVTRALDSESWPRVMEVLFPLPANSAVTLETLRHAEPLSRYEREWNVELVLQKESVHRRYKRLAVFDMDSTLIQQEVIDEIAAQLGPDFQRQVSAITAAAMNGELDFEQSLRKRCALLAGVNSTVWEDIKPRITHNHGAADLIRCLKRLGFKTAVLSGGFTPLAGWLARDLGLDYHYANHLVVSADGQTLTGELEGTIVHAEQKRLHTLAIAEKEAIALEQTLVVGDGANDLKMMSVAGLGVAFNAKARVQMEAPARLNSESLVDILYLLGISKEEQDDLLR